MESSLKLYELGVALEEIIQQIMDADGEIDEHTEAALDRLQLDFADKVEKCVMAIRAHKARAEMVKTEITRLNRMAEIQTNAANSLKNYVERVMRQAHVRKVDRPLGKAWIQKNAPRIVLPTGMAAYELPDNYQRVTIEPDKKLMLEDHKKGEQLPAGVTVVQSESLRVR